MKYSSLILVGAVLSLGACSTIEKRVLPSTIEANADTDGKCSADGLDAWIGKQATVESGTDVVRKSGAGRIRWIPPRSAVTMDYREDRVNVSYDDNMVITSIKCG